MLHSNHKTHAAAAFRKENTVEQSTLVLADVIATIFKSYRAKGVARKLVCRADEKVSKGNQISGDPKYEFYFSSIRIYVASVVEFHLISSSAMLAHFVEL